MSSRAEPDEAPVLGARSSGVLAHVTSLPGEGVGDLGAGAYRFIDWLAGAGQGSWQILPLVPVDEGGSPYNGLSALAGNPLLVSLEELVREGLLESPRATERFPDDRVDFARVLPWKDARLREAHRAFRRASTPELEADFAAYRAEHRQWLDDYALFRALRHRNGGVSWTEWDPGERDREPAALAAARAELEEEVERHEFDQFLFDRQWAALRRHARERGVRIVGDLPIFVAHDSADVWANREIFQLDEAGRPEVVAGVPPDYFSETGQRWGNPLYRWDVLRESGYDWWLRRLRRTLSWVDIVRIDHFRGFESYWEIPGDAETAVEGEWRPGPGAHFFRAAEERLGELPLIAEDLGIITREVELLRDELRLPGMRVLQFAFDGDEQNPHLPGNHPANSIAYTGTHDNDTTAGWWASASAENRRSAERLLDLDGEPIHWRFIDLALRSPARLAVVPLQDVLGKGSEARMNTPGAMHGNWGWRVRAEELTRETQEKLRALTRASRRLSDRSV